MSILIANVAGTCLTRTSDVLDCASAFTMMAWIYMPSGRTWATNYLALWPSEYHYYFCNIRRDGGNLKLRLRSPSTGTDDSTLNTTISTDVWYHVAATRTGNTFELLVNGASIGTTTYSDSLSTYSMAIGEPDGTGTQDYVQDAKFWARQLSLAEIQAEMRSRRPVTWDSLYAWYPLIGDSNLYLDDYSGRSRDWTATNAPTMGTIGPAVAYRPQETLFWPLAATAAGSTYTITCSAGSFTLTGNAAAIVAARQLLAAAGSLSLTGNAAALAVARKIAAVVGGYVLTGNDAGLSANRKLLASAGSFALTGNDAALRALRKLAASPGSYSMTGYDATFVYYAHTPASSLPTEGGVYVMYGNSAIITINYDRTLKEFASASGG